MKALTETPPFHEISLTAMTYGGDALGRLPDGRAAFVPFGLPGERVRVRLVEEKRGHVRAELLEVLEPAPERIAARCKHFGICGGCHYQHMSYEAQLKAKTEILRDQLMRIGKIADPPVGPPVAAPGAWNYRNHVQFHLTHEGKLGFVSSLTRPTLSPPSVPRLRSGIPYPLGDLRQADVLRDLPSGEGSRRRGEHVFPISECHLPEPAINASWPRLDFGPNSDIERVSLRLGSDEELMLILEGRSPEIPALEIAADISAVHVFEEHAVVMAGDDDITMRVLGRDFHVSAGSFFQVNTGMSEKMVEHVLKLMPGSVDTILDVFCGVGLFSAFLAPHCKRLIGIESAPSACQDFSVNLDEFDHVELYQGTAEEVVPHLEANPDLVLVDPPRAGLEKRVPDGILKLSPPAIIYVSCDPSTLARDAARLIVAGFDLKSVVLFDLFPQTYHIESISLFKR